MMCLPLLPITYTLLVGTTNCLGVLKSRLTQPLDMALSGTEEGKQRSLSSWQSMGVALKYQTPETRQKLTALSGVDLWLVRPDKELGRAFLVTNNFRTLLHWNKSNYFAISIGMFADRIEQRVGI